MASLLILGCGSSTVVEKITHDPKFADLNLAATGRKNDLSSRV